MRRNHMDDVATINVTLKRGHIRLNPAASVHEREVAPPDETPSASEWYYVLSIDTK